VQDSPPAASGGADSNFHGAGSMKKIISRRRFLNRSVAASAVFSTFTISGTKASGRVLGANDTIRLAVCGIGGQGKNHVNEFSQMKGVVVPYLVDPDSRLHKSRSETVLANSGTSPQCFQDPRDVLSRSDVDAVSIATPNHWHSLLTIWACEAGKDVYVEKPLSHNISEGRRCVEAADKWKRIVQHGTQERSGQSRANEIAAVHSEKYGKLLVSKGYCCKSRWSIGFQPNTQPPSELNFDIWLGPAEQEPYHANLVPYNWHWFWPTGNGDIGNQGVHQIDVARWAIKGSTLPEKVWSLGGRFAYKDQGVTPNTQMAVFEFGEVKLVFEVRGLVEKNPKFPKKVGNEYYTTEGMIANGKFYPKNGGASERLADFNARVMPGGRYASFIHAVRSRKQEDINAPVLDGHYSSALCHLANASYRLGESVPFNQKTRSLGDDKIVLETFSNLQENLTGVGVKLENESYQLGRVLKFDPKAEQFIDCDEANRMLTRQYRPPFVVPDQIA
jgi:predicted dehydrogenase